MVLGPADSLRPLRGGNAQELLNFPPEVRVTPRPRRPFSLLSSPYIFLENMLPLALTLTASFFFFNRLLFNGSMGSGTAASILLLILNRVVYNIQEHYKRKLEMWMLYCG